MVLWSRSFSRAQWGWLFSDLQYLWPQPEWSGQGKFDWAYFFPWLSPGDSAGASDWRCPLLTFEHFSSPTGPFHHSVKSSLTFIGRHTLGFQQWKHVLWYFEGSQLVSLKMSLLSSINQSRTQARPESRGEEINLTSLWGIRTCDQTPGALLVGIFGKRSPLFQKLTG